MRRRVVITGLGVVSPVGLGIQPTFDALVDKRCGIRRIAAFDPARFDAQIAGEVAEFKVADFVPKNYRKFTKVMARDIELAVIAAYLAVRDAGLKTKCLIDRGEADGATAPNIDVTRFGANIGAGLICADLTELAGALASAVEDPSLRESRTFSLTRWGREGMNNLTPLWLLKFLPNMLACHVTIVHDCQAPSNTLTCGEASSHLAIGEAFRTISRGAADICICGGAESKLNPMGLIRQSLLGRLNGDANDAPHRACRPFDKARRGTVISEGGGLIILEELSTPSSRASMPSWPASGASQNAADWGRPQTDGRAMARHRPCARDASAAPEQVDLVNAAGVGTADDDLGRGRRHRACRPRTGRQGLVLATKGAIGNNAAGSAIDLAITTLLARGKAVAPRRTPTTSTWPAD
ncbi:MAG: beta-ketoacyl synthase N-terminal-like domain-containing protein [Phycisphaerae bacterium]